MKLYNRTGVSAISSPEFGEFIAEDDNSIIVPEELGRYLHNLHTDGVRVWEDEGERFDRLAAEELARRSAPDYLAGIVEELAAQLAAQATPAKRAYNKKSDIPTEVVKESVSLPAEAKPDAIEAVTATTK